MHGTGERLKGPVVVAIDGPGASGKSTVSRAVAGALGFAYVDTGAMYRTLAWHCLKAGVDLKDSKAVASACRRWKTRLFLEQTPAVEVALLVDGYRPRDEIRSKDVSAAASDVAVVASVRAWMKSKQRECIQFGNLVMEGRDIATNVFPETDFKFWLDASPSERIRRRQAQGVDENLAARDRQDSQRAAAPLMVGLGSVRIDTTGRTVEDIVGEIVGRVRGGG
jgi:cytidylate kinase